MLQGEPSAKEGPKQLEDLFWSTKTTFETPKVPRKFKNTSFLAKNQSKFLFLVELIMKTLHFDEEKKSFPKFFEIFENCI